MNKSHGRSPAFPVAGDHTNRGVTIRDYFAAQVMPAIYSLPRDGDFRDVAKLAYQMADAMIAERSKFW